MASIITVKVIIALLIRGINDSRPMFSKDRTLYVSDKEKWTN